MDEGGLADPEPDADEAELVTKPLDEPVFGVAAAGEEPASMDVAAGPPDAVPVGKAVWVTPGVTDAPGVPPVCTANGWTDSISVCVTVVADTPSCAATPTTSTQTASPFWILQFSINDMPTVGSMYVSAAVVGPRTRVAGEDN